MRPYPQLAKHEDSNSAPDSQHPLFTGTLPVGMLTADAPRFQSAPGGHPALKQDLDSMGVQYDETEGHYGGPENSFLVYGLPREQLYALGKKYGQEAVIHNEGGKREFIYTNGPNEGTFHPGLDTYEHWKEPPEDYYTKVPDAGYVRLHFNFDERHPVAVMPPAPAAQAPTSQAPSGAVPARAAAAPVTKHEIGFALYQALRKVQDGLAQSGQLAPGNNSATLSRPFPHPNAYPWHDGHTDHHYKGFGPGGVLISRSTRLAKHDAPGAQPTKHPHVDGAIPTQAPKNDQAAGAGVKSYSAFALPFGHIDHDAKARGGSNLFHYDYHGKNDAVNKLVADHGFQTYYAGGKFGKPDLANRNYNTKHLMVYDPTPQSGGDFGDQQYTDSWRKTHELAHALTYPEVNKLYGEGRRIGKLGSHRTPREALRAVHWEWLAAHKQRELNRSLGIDVPDEIFNRETNTVMHDAAHRAVTGKFTEPSQEGFTPHSHLVPLETSLGMVREHARGLGLQGDHDLLKKSMNLTDLESTVAEDEKFTVPEALAYLAKGARERVAKFEQDCLTLRKAELAKAQPLKKSMSPLMKARTKTDTSGGTIGGAGGGTLPPASPPPPAPAPQGRPTLPGELAKRDEDLVEKFAKGEYPMKKDEDDGAPLMQSEGHVKKTELPAGASPDAPGEKIGEKKNNPVKAGVKEQDIAGKGGGGSDGLASKKTPLAKAALAGAGGAAAPPPKPAGGAPLGGAAKPLAMGGAKPGGMKLPKMPGAKPAAPAAAKTPPMGAGSPQAQVQKAENDPAMKKAELRKDLTWDPKQPATGKAPTPTFADGPGGSHGPGVAAGNQGLKAQSPIMRRRKSAGALMDRMGAHQPAAAAPAPASGLHPALAAAATPPPLPAAALAAPTPAQKGASPKLPHAAANKAAVPQK